MKYDSALFGYGLTISLLNKIRNELNVLPQTEILFDYNNYLENIICTPGRNKLWKDFERYFDNVPNGTSERHVAKKEICKRFQEMNGLTFEQWVGKYLFSNDSPIDPGLRSIMYLMYNHWGYLVSEKIFSWKSTQLILEELSANINEYIKDSKYIFTTNFDTYLSTFLDVKYIHGKFVLPLRKFSSFLKVAPYDQSRFEYPYLFGGNGYEKQYRLSRMEEMDFGTYDFSFLFAADFKTEHLLIYGMSFNSTPFITSDFLSKHPKYKKEIIYRSIDGHILDRLQTLKTQQKLNKITIAYHTPQDEIHLKKFFQIAKIDDITEYKHTSEFEFI